MDILKYVEALRRATRPIITISVTFAMIALMFKIFWSAELPPLPIDLIIMMVASFAGAVSTCIIFWFASRQNTSNTSNNSQQQGNGNGNGEGQ